MSTPFNLPDPDRRAAAERQMPAPHKHDCRVINVRKVFIRRQELGFKPTSLRTIRSVLAIGYDATVIKQASTFGLYGKSEFRSLCDAGRLDLTSEYIAFQFFRERLTSEFRVRLAKLMLENDVAEYL
jgi:hypothetical protein